MAMYPMTPELAVAQVAIREVLSRYAHMAREGGDLDAMAELFTPDAAFILPDGTPVSRHEIYKIVGHPPVYIRHHITTIVIDFVGEDTARAKSFFFTATEKAMPDHWGYWDDELRLVDDGRWLISRKAPIIEGFAPDGDWPLGPWANIKQTVS